MALRIDQFRHKRTGEPLGGFFVRNRLGKVLAIGAKTAIGHSANVAGFVSMQHRRYANDLDLVAAIERLTGIRPRAWQE